MPALAEFLKGTVNDALTKVLQPAGLIPGALFVLLNLGIVLPRATAEKVGLAKAYSGLDSGVQVIVISTLILVVGYLLLASSGAILDTLAGRTWRMSLLGTLMRVERNHRRNKLDQRIEGVYAEGKKADIERLDELLWRRRTRMAPKERESATTALGDVIDAFEHGIRARYGLNVPALWEPLRATLATDDKAASDADAAKATLDLMANLTFAVVVFVLEAVIVFTIFDDHSAVLFSVAGMAASYVAYRLTVAKAVSWYDAIDTTVALHAHDMLEKLGIRKPTSGADRRELLDRAADFMLRDVADDDLFGPVLAAPVVTTSPNLVSTAQERDVREPAQGAAPTAKYRESIAYTLFVTTAKDTMPFTRGNLIFEDARLPRLSPKPEHARRLRGGAGATTHESLSWRVAASCASSKVMEFELDRWRISVDGDLTVAVEQLTDDTARFLTVRAVNAHPDKSTLRVFHAADGATHKMVAHGDLTESTPEGCRDRTFELPGLGKGKTHRVVLTLEKVD